MLLGLLPGRVQLLAGAYRPAGLLVGVGLTPALQAAGGHLRRDAAGFPRSDAKRVPRYRIGGNSPQTAGSPEGGSQHGRRAYLEAWLAGKSYSQCDGRAGGTFGLCCSPSYEGGDGRHLGTCHAGGEPSVGPRGPPSAARAAAPWQLGMTPFVGWAVLAPAVAGWVVYGGFGDLRRSRIRAQVPRDQGLVQLGRALGSGHRQSNLYGVLCQAEGKRALALRRGLGPSTLLWHREREGARPKRSGAAWASLAMPLPWVAWSLAEWSPRSCARTRPTTGRAKRHWDARWTPAGVWPRISARRRCFFAAGLAQELCLCRPVGGPEGHSGQSLGFGATPGGCRRFHGDPGAPGSDLERAYTAARRA